ncbi:MAG: DUF1330 domain-containing protein [Panacagrimonas sp.]
MRSVEFDAELIRAFDALPDDGSPILMLNLLRFRERADYAAHPQEPPRSGVEAYRHYIGLAMPIVEAAAGRIVMMGTHLATLIAPTEEHWHDLLLLDYPTRKPFIEAMTSAAYARIAYHRTAALLDSRLIAFRGGATSFLPV